METLPGGSSRADDVAPRLAAAEDQARLLGRLEGERIDSELREREGAEREDRLARLAFAVEDEWLTQAAVGSADSARLRSQVEELAAFHGAVLRSRGWLLLQLLRRPFGRAW